MPTSIYILVLVTFQIVSAPSELFCLYSNSWTPLIQSPKGKGKWFELTGVQINEVKISSKALQGKWIILLLRICGDFKLLEFELPGQLYHCISSFSAFIFPMHF